MTAAESPLFGAAQFPAPVIYATTDDVVEIRLKNLGVSNPDAPDDPHSIHLHGLDVDAANDGVPETSLGAVGAGTGEPGAGNVVVYMFSPSDAGTYMYHCHQEADIHVQMGMYGALVVYNRNDQAAAGGPGTGKGKLWGWNYDRDYILLLSEVDLGQHLAEEDPEEYEYNPVDYHPQYWFINGLSFPNTIHAGAGFNWTDWIAAHPGYDPFIRGSVSSTGTGPGRGEKILLRMINLGFETQPMHMHGYHGKIIGSDQRAWPWANTAGRTPFGQGLEKNTLTIGSGETYEWLIDMGQQWTATPSYAPNATSRTGTALESSYPGGTQSRYDPETGLPTSNTNTGDPAIIDPFTGAPYIAGPQVTGAQGVPAQGQFFPFHNHDDYKATNNGEYPGGMFTIIEALP
jgi:FtsP/CotA-like multicopper oxidase with cupredoxin domain